MGANNEILRQALKEAIERRKEELREYEVALDLLLAEESHREAKLLESLKVR